MSALVIALHGSRHPGASEVASGLRDAVSARLPDTEVATAWVDVRRPHVSDVVAELIGSPRHADVVVVPAFLTRGYHVDFDLPRAVAASGTAVTLTAHVGPHLLDAVVDRLAEAGGPGDAVVLAVAGSARPGSVAEVEAAAALLAARLGVPVRLGFQYAAEPKVEDAVATLAAVGFTDIAVARFVLAPGAAEARFAALPGVRVAAPIGVHRALTNAVVAAYRGASLTRSVRVPVLA